MPPFHELFTPQLDFVFRIELNEIEQEFLVLFLSFVLILLLGRLRQGELTIFSTFQSLYKSRASHPLLVKVKRTGSR